MLQVFPGQCGKEIEGKISMESLIIRGRTITPEDISLIRFLIKQSADRGKTFISIKLAETWKWYQPNGRLKDRACRDILTVLERKKAIYLPFSPKRSTTVGRAENLSKWSTLIEATPIEGRVKGLKPFTIKMVTHTPLEDKWNYLMRTYHYLGHKVLVGAYLKYLVFIRDRVVAATGWGSAVWKLAPRDNAIGWTIPQRNRNLHRVANNSRFLI